MKKTALVALAPLALLLSACTTVHPVYKDNGRRIGPCTSGGPDSVAQAFYDLRLQHPLQGIPDSATLNSYRPYLSDNLYQSLRHAANNPQQRSRLQGDIFSSVAAGPDSARVMDASSVPGGDARNIPLRVSLSRNGNPEIRWQDEVLMVHEGRCWAIDDVRYLAKSPHIDNASLTGALEK
ncbi:lipoprotein [Erwinia sp. OLTSP20]|uniref:lipoprotein n=1 Tax=unclassified Erwinia TaxID=2622719 RepID=UPI000C17E495|nr:MULTISPECIES: lipoprotein [unclassified Erwinia]PIJ51291.1 lipoprotein [Erwinia sp. OAMSP11]PIJ74076.1 lipoprotein [Erwinia sp. OLSSP12]PIJ81182.1 lipoprotein [Erwinia sp. OLCASP19]PIJ86039.1 lipoprotein [Erwinia sp. OLMTSP26]PIJ87788.1 lipoprotein [Erwinia sp. OLMDSP33]